MFALKQALALYDFSHQCIDECDAKIERAVALLNIERAMPEAPLLKAKAHCGNAELLRMALDKGVLHGSSRAKYTAAS